MLTRDGEMVENMELRGRATDDNRLQHFYILMIDPVKTVLDPY